MFFASSKTINLWGYNLEIKKIWNKELSEVIIAKLLH